jgi:flagellar biosynthesis protein FlhG
MVGPVAKGIALISGAGGSGRTTVGLNLAASLARDGRRVLFFDMCFGWGGLNSIAEKLPTLEQILNYDDHADDLISVVEGGPHLLTCIPPDFLDFGEDELKRIAFLANRIGRIYDCVVFDPPSGAHPLALMSSGLSERVFLFTRPDPMSVASSYCLVKSLYSEGIYTRVRIVFSFVESAEHAASLKTRFDIVTNQFLDLRIADGGFVYRRTDFDPEDSCAALITEENIASVRNINLENSPQFQDETRSPGVKARFPIS